MTLEEAYEYVDHGIEAEGEQRAEYGSGCASLGYDPYEWGAAYEGYRTADDPVFAEAEAIIAASAPPPPAPRPVIYDEDDIPF